MTCQSDRWREENAIKRAQSNRSATEDYRHALEQIREECGRVCEQYEICTHASCGSSHQAWEIAADALKRHVRIYDANQRTLF